MSKSITMLAAIRPIAAVSACAPKQQEEYVVRRDPSPSRLSPCTQASTSKTLCCGAGVCACLHSSAAI